MGFSIIFKEEKNQIGKIIKKLPDNISETLFDLAGFMQRERTENIDQKIYKQPESPRYVRSGRALGGTSINELQGGKAYKVIDNSKIKGATKNYSPFLNRNSRISRFNTKYFDDAVKETRKESKKVLKSIFET